MYHDICEAIWLKIGLMIDTTKLKSVILVCFTFTLNQDHEDARKFQLSAKAMNECGRNFACC